MSLNSPCAGYRVRIERLIQLKAKLLIAASISICWMVGIAQAETLNHRITRAFEAGALPGLHSTIVDLKGERLSEVYFDGIDQSWGTPLGKVEHGPDTLHDLRSVTKSIVGLLYGIALDEGKVPAPEEPLLDQFPQYADLKDGSSRESITIEHALTMKMGMQWNENLPYTNPKNSEIAMERSKDRYRYVLDRPMEIEPGKKWTYSGGAVAILAKLIKDGTGMPIDEYAERKLFEPLGIKKFHWIRSWDKVPSAASGLRLTAPDLAKIGALVSNSGKFNGQQIVPADWLERSFKPRAETGFGLQYGYLWYMSGLPEQRIYVALGNGGQRLTVQPSFDFVVTSFAGNYNKPYGWQSSYKVIADYAVPAVMRELKK